MRHQYVQRASGRRSRRGRGWGSGLVRAAASRAIEPLEARLCLTGNVLVTLIHDVNGNGVKDAEEPGLQGWTVFVDYDRDGVLGVAEPSAVSNIDGEALLTGIPDDTWDVRQILRPGFAPSPGSDVVERLHVRDGEKEEVAFFNVEVSGSGRIEGTVWNDIGRDGVRGAGDPGMPGWTVYLDLDDDRVLDPGEPQDVTDAAGFYFFDGLASGQYRVREILPPGWDPTVGGDSGNNVDVTAGGTTVADFGNFNIASIANITGTVWNDVNADGFRGGGDPGLGGWTVFLDLDLNGTVTAGEPTALTDPAGVYTFASVVVGTYRVTEVLQDGWNTSPGHPVAVDLVVVHEGANRVEFANYTPTLGSISGTVWEDADGNGSIGGGELGIAGWTVYVDMDADGTADAGEPSAVTDATGSYTITGVAVGSMVVRAVAQVGWTATAPGTGMQLVTVLNASNVGNVNFGSKRRTDSAIAGTVFADANGNGTREVGEEGLPGIVIYLDMDDDGVKDPVEPSVTTSGDLYYTPAVNEAGRYEFTHLPGGTFRVRQVVPELLSATPAAQREELVVLADGEARGGVDFADVYRANEIHGVVFDDVNRNHVRDPGEVGVGGVTVYIDLNRNEVADPGEPRTVTGSDGSYAFLTNLSPGSYVVRALHHERREYTYPTTLGGILWPAGVSNPAQGNVSPAAGITASMAEGQTSGPHTVSLTLPSTGALTDKVDVFLLFDDTGSFTSNSPIVRAAFSQIISTLQTALPGLDMAFGVGRLEEYANFGSEFASGRPFILNQPIVSQTTVGFTAAIQAALDRMAPGYGGDLPETDIEALFQMATGRGFDGNNNGTTTDSGAAGLVSTQLNPGASGDVPAFGSYVVDPSGAVLPASGTIGGAGFRAGALPIILLATDTGFAYQPRGETTVTGVNGLTLPVSALTQFSRPTTPFSAGAGLQETITALNALGALVVGLGTNGVATADPRQGLEALAKLTGAINQSVATIPNGTLDSIAPGDPMYFQISSGFGTSVANGVVTAIQNAVSNVSVNVTVRASDPSVHLTYMPGVINNVGAGQTATFDVTFTGDGRPHRFDLQFVREGTDVVLGSIPVVLGTPIPGDGYDYVELEDGEIEIEEDFGDSEDLALPGNVAPSFVKGADQGAEFNAGAQVVAGWATGISAGPASEAGQVLDFIVSNDNNALFAAQPSISADGTLTFTPAAGASGTATVTVRLHDSGGSVGGGEDTSGPQTFTITVGGPVTLTLPGTGGDDVYEVRLEDGRVRVFAGGTLLHDVSRGALAGIGFDAGAGSDRLTLVGKAGVADGLTVGAGAAAFGGVPIALDGVEEIAFDGKGGDDEVIVTGGPTVTLPAVQRLAALTVGGDGTVAVAPGLGEAVVTRALSVSGSGRLDLAGSALLVDYAAGASPVAGVRAALLSARAGGTWAGPGVRSSAGGPAVGYAEAADLGMTWFAGAPVDPTALLVRPALVADANLDGTINGDDFALTDRGRLMGLGVWVFGDFDYDGVVTGADVGMLNRAAAPAPAPATEPTVEVAVVATPVVTATPAAVSQPTVTSERPAARPRDYRPAPKAKGQTKAKAGPKAKQVRPTAVAKPNARTTRPVLESRLAADWLKVIASGIFGSFRIR